MAKTNRSLAFAAAISLAALTSACGDDENVIRPDAPSALPDGPPGDPPDAGEATPDGGGNPAIPTIDLTLSAAGGDQLMSIVPDGAGGFYAAGYMAATLTDPRNVVVAKLTAEGLDTTWGGGDGIVETGLVFRGGSDEIDITMQGAQLLVSATVANGAEPLDTDVAVVRLDADGTVDDGFGDAGVAIIDLNSAIIDGTTVTGGDRARSIGVDGAGLIYVHAVQRGEGDFMSMPRTDTDFVVFRLDADGDLDGGYGDAGKTVADLRGGAPDFTPSSATPRQLHVLADGSVIASGYAVTPAFGSGPQAVLYRLDAGGDFDDGFAFNGVFHDVVLAAQTEIYGFAVHGDDLVTGGYGRDTGDQNDWVSMRFDVATGARDTTFGGAPNGAVVNDVSGALIGDNCRGALGLPGGKTLLFGSTGPSNDPAQDAVFLILDADGTVDDLFGGAPNRISFGGNDQIWGGAVSGDTVILVGWKGGGPTDMQTAAMNDDAYGVVLTLP